MIKLSLKVALFFPVLFQLFSISLQQGCNISIADLAHPQPLVLTAYTLKFLYPQANDTYDTNVTLARGETILLACPGGQLNLVSQPSQAYAFCNTFDQLVLSDGTAFDFQAITCDNGNISSVRVSSQNCANVSTNRLVEIGFEIGGNLPFLTLATVCYDFLARSPVYANYTLTKTMKQSHVYPEVNEKYTHDGFLYNLSVAMDQLYEFNHSRSTLNNVLGFEGETNDSIRHINGSFFREEVASRRDFFYAAQKQAMFRDFVTWPQWHDCFPSQELNRYVYYYTYDHEVDLVVYNGVNGVSTLPHAKTGEPVEIYLYADGQLRAVPVPVLMWRLVYEPLSKKAVVLASIDNGRLLNARDFLLCEDISRNISWIHWENPYLCNGYAYACTYEDFKKAVPYLPDLNVTGVLN